MSLYPHLVCILPQLYLFLLKFYQHLAVVILSSPDSSEVQSEILAGLISAPLSLLVVDKDQDTKVDASNRFENVNIFRLSLIHI